ncbi:MAG: hypothetical protein ACTSU2_02720 [Promethearchaeota archaeon]
MKVFNNNSITYKNNEFFFDKTPFTLLKNNISSPSFIFLKSRIVENIITFSNLMQKYLKNSHVYYSVKANYIPKILKIINELHDHISFEIISDYEFELLNRNSLNTDDLLVGGPYLQNELIEKVVRTNNVKFIIYNLNDLKRLNLMSSKYKIKTNVILRFESFRKNTPYCFQNNEQEIKLISSFIKKLDNISLIGLLSHIGTQINSINNYIDNAKSLLNIAKLFKKYNIDSISHFNHGGGFPIASSFEAQLGDIFKNIQNIFNDEYPEAHHIFEPGRYIIGDAGFLITKIINIKDLNTMKKVIFLNAGTHILPRFAKNTLRLYNLNIGLKHYNTPIDFYGIIPSSEDIIAKNYNFSSNNKIGDDILILNCGAYSLTFSNRFPYKFPDIYLLDKKLIKLKLPKNP